MATAYDQLSPKRKLFVDAYIATGNGSAAAKAAGYATKANVQGARLLAVASIQAALKERQAGAQNARILTAQQVLEELSAIARQDDDLRAKTKALELLGKRFRLFVDQVEIEHKGDAGVLVLPKVATREEWEALWGRKPNRS